MSLFKKSSKKTDRYNDNVFLQELNSKEMAALAALYAIIKGVVFGIIGAVVCIISILIYTTIFST